jgi:hypothetical protein
MSGILYLCTNPAWPGWVKVGTTSEESKKKRLNMYQTSSPFKDFEFETIINTPHNTLLEDAVLIHFNKLKTPSEWVNKSHQEVLDVLNYYIKKADDDIESLKEWVESKKDKVVGDTYKYIKYGLNNTSTKYFYKVTCKEQLKHYKEKMGLEFDLNEVVFNKLLSSSELAKQLNLYKNGLLYAAMVCSLGRDGRYGFERFKI